MISLEKCNIWHLYKNCPKCGRFGQNNCCHRLWKVAQSAISRPIWSHCKWLTLILLFMDRALQTDRSITQLFFDRNSFLCFSNRPTDVLFIGPNRGNRFDETIKFSTSLFFNFRSLFQPSIHSLALFMPYLFLTKKNLTGIRTKEGVSNETSVTRFGEILTLLQNREILWQIYVVRLVFDRRLHQIWPIVYDCGQLLSVINSVILEN